MAYCKLPYLATLVEESCVADAHLLQSPGVDEWVADGVHPQQDHEVAVEIVDDVEVRVEFLWVDLKNNY